MAQQKSVRGITGRSYAGNYTATQPGAHKNKIGLCLGVVKVAYSLSIAR